VETTSAVKVKPVLELGSEDMEVACWVEFSESIDSVEVAIIHMVHQHVYLTYRQLTIIIL
jgi:hypothetical protein